MKPAQHTKQNNELQDTFKSLWIFSGQSKYIAFFIFDNKYKLFISIFKAHDGKAFSPKFPKPKDEGWMFVIGDSDSNELHALKRVGIVHKSDTNVSLVFFTPENTGRKIFTLYVMSDSYLGLDQQYEIYLDILPPPPGNTSATAPRDGKGSDDDVYMSDWL